MSVGKSVVKLVMFEVTLKCELHQPCCGANVAQSNTQGWLICADSLNQVLE